ncbi:hypothetical protein V5F69_10975 [Xanthobacter sp. V2C-4]|uniref:hypothetical protein n=1 Tax=Xanthobacter albus TaxID=3119929 RepID=UPI00372C3E0F
MTAAKRIFSKSTEPALGSTEKYGRPRTSEGVNPRMLLLAEDEKLNSQFLLSCHTQYCGASPARCDGAFSKTLLSAMAN